jgi:RimJ/RimL family protein N-acetyltransferase
MKAETDSEKDFFDCECPYCRKEVSFPKEWTGTIQACLWCAQNFVIPYGPSETPKAVSLEIRTERLLLRRLKVTDTSDLLEFLSDKNSLMYSDMRTMTQEEVDGWLAADTKSEPCLNPSLDTYFGIELLAEPKLIALVSFEYRGERFKGAGFDLVVNKQFRRQGYGTEIVRGVLEFAFERANLHRVAMGCCSEDTAGLRMFAKAGLRREGELIESRLLNGKWMNMTVVAMLQWEWNQSAST